MCLNGSFLALFQLERFALVRRRHGCGGRKGCCARRVTSNPRAMHTGGGEIRVTIPFLPHFARTYVMPSRFWFRVCYVYPENHVAWLEMNRKIGSRSGRHVAWAHALDREIWLPITTVSLSRVQ